MKFRNTVQLGALLVVLILLYFGWQLMQRQSAAVIHEAKRVFDFEAADIRELTIQQLDAPPTTGARDEAGAWSITAPHPAIKPNVLLWDRVAAQAAGLLNERTLPEGGLGPESYGLDLPRLTIGLEAKGADHMLRFGFLDPTQTYRYARLDEGPVFLASKDAVFELDRPLDLLREAYVVDDHESPVLRLEFARIMTEAIRQQELAAGNDPPPVGTESDIVIIVERPNAESPWLQLSPIHTAANQEKVDELVKEIQHARGRNFVDAPESYADYGLEPASIRMTIENAAGHRQTFFFGDIANTGDAGGVWVRKDGEPSVFLLDGHITTLYPRQNALRERRLITRPVGAFQKLEYRGRDQQFTLALSPEGAWKMVDPPLDDTDELYVTQYIAALKSLEALQFFEGDPAAYGLDNPEATIRFTGAESQDALEIRLTPNPQDPDQYYVLTDAGEIGGIPAEHIRFAVTSAAQFRNLSLLRFEPNRAVRMDLQIDGVEYTLEKEYNRWLVKAPANYFMPNQRDAVSLILAVAGLRAAAVEEVVEEDPTVYGFEHPRFRFSVTLAPELADGAPETLGPLEVGSVVPGIDDERFARTPSREGVFRVKQSLIETVSAAVSGIRTRSGTGSTSN